jgi:phospholipid/cholesterol/gamma-HCH transport system permease protein
MSAHRLEAPQRLTQSEGLALLKDFATLRVGSGAEVLLDLSRTEEMDALGGACIVRLSEMAQARGATLRCEGATGHADDFLQLIRPAVDSSPTPRPRPDTFFARLGGSAIAVWAEVKDFMNLVVDAIYWTLVAPLTGQGIRWKNLVDELFEMGTRAVGIVCLMNFLLGLIIAMLMAKQAESYGIQLFVADIMMIGFARELAAIMTAVVVSARTGAAIAAEISTMVVQEEVDALRGMGLNVAEFLVAPKLLALLIALPCLVTLGMYSGILGGAVWGMFVLGFTADIWFTQTLNAAYLSDIFQGFAKTFVFAVFIVLIGCHNGFRVKGGSRGVGLMTTRAVVMDIFMLITVDIVFATLFYYVFP